MSRFYRTGRPRMTADDARHFDHGISVGNVVALLTQVDGRKADGEHSADCRCEPYADFFTIRRWNAQGFHVKRGSRSFRIPVVIESEREAAGADGAPVIDPATGAPKREKSRRLWTACVFCRCQVETSTKAARIPAESAVLA